MGNQSLEAVRSKISIVGLTDSAETLLIPLYFRALDAQALKPALNDKKAVDIVNRLDYDFSRIKAKAVSQEGVILRAQAIDREVKTFVARYPDCVVVEIGCGLDTRFFRTDNGSLTWFDLDFPDVIALRRTLFSETSRNRFISQSVLDYAWMDEVNVRAEQRIIFVAEAVFPYLSKTEVKDLFLKLKGRYPGCEIIFDGVPSILAAMGGRLHPNLWHTRAHLRWGLGQANAVEAWSEGIRLIAVRPYYLDGSKQFRPFGRCSQLFTPFFGDFKVVRYQLGDLSSSS